ncbi:hypothetical protein DYB37_002763, partial [Aphanomyces astaci]
STKRQKQAKALSSMKVPTGISFGHPSAAPVKTLQESMRRYALPKLSQVDLEAIKKDVVIHFYITGTSFHRVDQFHLKRAFQRARPGIVLPNRQALAKKYLDICYHEVEEETDRRLGAPDTQVDRVPVSEVFDAFVHQLPHAIGDIWSLNLHESKYIVAAVKARWDFVYSDAHGMGSLLDLQFVDSGFDSMEFKEDVVDFVVNYPPSDTAPSTNSRRDALSRDLKEFQKYCLKLHSAKGWRLEELKSKKKTVAKFWVLDGQAWPLLRELALRVFNLVASSAASERNFSMHGFIQSKKRNRLSPSTVTKLMYIKTNYNLEDEVGGKDYSSDEYTNSE